ncbi:glycosyltransferase family 2 protein [Sporolactobacillus terrae]|uniref:Glycosyltransferase n=1 Tax=Sporolactobacillus terrae TaxID=269673 RepID=A0A410DA52_9BACL|nr:glycosyltransferase family 2 protein [Sporolactobacillus terrae]QAA22969.1 glycosyltransferase [Sporolactobacillus terrae]QAA25942.1 glycosyltransferase [Sporolactobacillus terrae]UAK17816.1 glycosyltransferase family 2 protein [Sporolactobacillus terrae]BBN99370.1 putative glycosyltransferase YkcC [Sporolactobacillus terrae]
MTTKYSIVVPVFNEEQVIYDSYKRLKTVMDRTYESYELLFVNDGSRDRTSEILNYISEGDTHVKVIEFSRNFGHQIAITAGMDYAMGQAIVVIDADLQDPPELILQMIGKWKEGFEVVYGKRMERKGESFFKKKTAALFYRILRVSTDIDIPLDTGDFRLIDRRVCDEMKRIPEKNRFIRGLVSWVGFKQTAVEYIRDERLAGETKYPLKKMLKLSIDGLTSFSYKPLKLATYGGALLSFAGFVYMIIALGMKLFTSSTVPGWTSLIVIQLLFSGFTLFILGVIGEYIGRIYDETKDRPLYIIRETKGFGAAKHVRALSSVKHG